MKSIKLVKSFAYKRKDVIQRLQSNESYQFYRHITKILANRDTIEVDHWKTECYSFCSWIMDLKIKPNNEPVDSYLLMEYFFYFWRNSRNIFKDS